MRWLGSGHSGPSWRRYAVHAVLCAALGMVWAASTPMFSVPDEISHMVRSAAAARGDLSGTPSPGGPVYDVPAVLAPTGDPDGVRGGVCYAGIPSQSASCLGFRQEDGERTLPSSAAPYPPLYYVLTGWPSLLFSGVDSLYAMRAASVVVFALLVTLAISTLDVHREWSTALVGVAVSLTPMVWFLAGSVSPSSMAIGGALAAWTGGFMLANDDRNDVARRVWRFGLPLCVLLLARRDSFLWGSLLVASLLPMFTWRRITHLLRAGQTWIWAAASCLSALSTIRAGAQAGSDFVEDSGLGSASGAFGSLPTYLQQMIGVLGWLDTVLPTPVYLLWYFVLGFLLIVTIAAGQRRGAVAAVAATVATTTTIVVVGANRFPYFQGRYGLPLAIGVPVLAALAATRTEAAAQMLRRSALVVLVAVAGAQWLALYQQFRRYSRSDSSSWWVFEDATWRPPTAPVGLLVIAHTALLAAFVWWWRRCCLADEALATAATTPDADPS